MINNAKSYRDINKKIFFTIYIIYAIDKQFINGNYKISSRTKYFYLVILKKCRSINPRATINFKYLHREYSKIQDWDGCYRGLIKTINKNIHPFINYDFVKERTKSRDLNYLDAVEYLISRELKFPCHEYNQTNIMINYETPPLTIHEALNLAGNTFVNEGRTLFPTLQ